MHVIRIPLKLPSLNDYVNANRRNRYAGATMKRNVENDISVFLKGVPKFKQPVKLHFVWCEANRRRDPDNVCSAKKFILDALVRNGILVNDTREYVRGFTDEFVDSDDYEVVVTLEEVR